MKYYQELFKCQINIKIRVRIKMVQSNANAVENNHFNNFPDEKLILNRFLELFSISGDAKRIKIDHEVSIYSLKPLNHTKEAFCFEKNILLVYSPQGTLPHNLLYSIEQYLNYPINKKNLETLCYIIISSDLKVREKVIEYINSSIESRIIIPFNTSELKKGFDWFVRNRFSEHLFVRDLFDIKQPLRDSNYFFGRKAIVRELFEKLVNGENIGLFGLRRTGKTSTIYQILNLYEKEKKGIGIKIDAQNPAIYFSTWWEVLKIIIEEISLKAKIKIPEDICNIKDEKSASKDFCNGIKYIINKINLSSSRILIVIDEIEHISAHLSINNGWDKGYLPFWQTMRSLQADIGKLSFMLVGVNALPIEKPSIDGVDNPLFGLINQYYIPSFDKTEVRDMVRTLGRYMGMHFDEKCYDYLKERYGGHPLLIRLACSYLHRRTLEHEEKRPISITIQKLKDTEEQRDLSLYYYGSQFLEVLKNFYRDEYDMLGLLSQGHYADFIELSNSAPEYREHLIRYGLITEETFPQITIECVKKFLLSDFFKKQKESIKNYESEEIIKGLVKLKEDYTDKIIKLKTRIMYKIDNNNKINPSKYKKPLWISGTKDAEIAVDLKGITLCRKSSDFNNFTSYLKQFIWEKADQMECKKAYPELYDLSVLLNGFRNYYQHPVLTESAAKNAERAFEEYCDGGFPANENDWSKLHIKMLEDYGNTLSLTLSKIS
ncbi:MAG: AAA-like domain-containing protein [Bacillota bacterium]|nr:AAA-like domain-containing protein [Bacillota bacterium]